MAMLGCFGLYHLVLALRVRPFSREDYHWWNVLVAVLGSSALYLLIHRLFHLHDQHGHWGWPLFALYFVALVRARTLEEKHNPKRKSSDGLPNVV